MACFLPGSKHFKRQMNVYVCILEFCVKRDPKWGGDKTYTQFEEVEKDFAEEVEEALVSQPEADVQATLMFDSLRPSTRET